MQSAISNRRTFVRNLLVGAPVLAGTTSMPHMLLAIDTHTHGGRLTPQLDSMLRDLARLHNQMRHRQLGPDDFRAVGAHLRSLASYRLQSNSDAELMRAVRTVVDSQGRDTLLSHRADPELMKRELLAFGSDNPMVTPALADTDRAAALERLARGGLSPALVEGAMTIDAATFAHLMAGPSSCSLIIELKQTMEAVTAVMCALAVAVPILAPDCFAATAVLASLTLMAYIAGC